MKIRTPCLVYRQIQTPVSRWADNDFMKCWAECRSAWYLTLNFCAKRTPPGLCRMCRIPIKLRKAGSKIAIFGTGTKRYCTNVFTSKLYPNRNGMCCFDSEMFQRILENLPATFTGIEILHLEVSVEERERRGDRRGCVSATSLGMQVIWFSGRESNASYSICDVVCLLTNHDLLGHGVVWRRASFWTKTICARLI